MTESRKSGDAAESSAPSGTPAGAPAKKVRSPSPRNCRNFIRRRTAVAMPEIVEKFVEEAKGGSVSHFTSLAKVGGFDKPPVEATQPRRRGKSLAQRLLDEVEQFEARHGITPGGPMPQPVETTQEESI